MIQCSREKIIPVSPSFLKLSWGLRSESGAFNGVHVRLFSAIPIRTWLPWPLWAACCASELKAPSSDPSSSAFYSSFTKPSSGHSVTRHCHGSFPVNPGSISHQGRCAVRWLSYLKELRLWLFRCFVNSGQKSPMTENTTSLVETFSRVQDKRTISSYLGIGSSCVGSGLVH